MKKLINIIKLVAINIVIFVLLLEIISLVIYFFNHKAFFYAHDRKAVEALESAEDRQLTAKRFHPFFGYTFKPRSTKNNNYGFNSPYDYLFKKEKAEQYIIAIFGGSVAEDFYTLGRERLTEKLAEHPFFANKEIIYLNFAMGGYKQPQQVQILSYFLSIGQHLDLAINIDGFNEVIFCSNNNRLNVDIGMPSAQHFLPMRDLVDSSAVTGEKLEYIWEIQGLKKKYKGVKDRVDNTFFASVHLIWSSYQKYLYKEYRSQIVAFDALYKPGDSKESIINIKYTPTTREEPVLLANVASLWYRSSLNMHSLMDGVGGRYFHFLQPNQYYAHKPFSEEEKKDAINNELAYNFLTKKGYPVLHQALEELKKKGVNAEGATGIFDSVKETVYIDACCHFNELGNEIFADFIAAQIKEELNN